MTHSKVLAQTLMKISQSKDSEKLVDRFFDYLEEKNFLSLLPQIKGHLKRLLEASTQEQKLVILTKHDLSEIETKEIISLVGADRDVPIETIKDESIIGGFSATYHGNIYDGSLKNQITQFKTILKS